MINKQAMAYRKALKLLDAGRDEEAMVTLNNVIEESQAERDNLNLVRSACVLGEYFFKNENFAEAKINLELVINAAVDEDEADILAFEIGLAKELYEKLPENKK